jgi:hypothetical protein
MVAIVIGARRRPLVLAYAAALVIGWLVFSAALKWQPWHSRLHLPFFVAAAPLAALAFEERGRLRLAIGGALLLGALPALLWNQSRPLVGSDTILARDRTGLYFTSVEGGIGPYAEATRVLGALGCTRIGLETGGGAVAEYPLWVLTQSLTREGWRIEHVGGAVRPQPTGEVFVPCSVIAWNHRAESYGHVGVIYRRVWGSADFGVYAPPSVLPTAPPWPFLVRLERMAGQARRPAPGVDRRPLIRVNVDGEAIRIGQRLSLAVDVRLPAETPPIHLYAGLLFPDGFHATVFTSPGVATPPAEFARIRTLEPFTTPGPVPPGTRVVLFDDVVSPAYPRGEYRIFAAIAPAHRPQSTDDADFLAADVRTVHVVP